MEPVTAPSIVIDTAPVDDDTVVIRPSVHYFGNPVALISTVDDHGRTNLSPISSSWSLGSSYALGLGAGGKAVDNLRCIPELVINLVDVGQTEQVERIAPTTGMWPVPEYKRDLYRHEDDKWVVSGFTPAPSSRVAPARVAECPVQIEATVTRMVEFDESAVLVEARVQVVHAHRAVVQPGTSRIDLRRWQPLYYTFRHYFGQGDEIGRTFKAEW